jgi:HAD superfamily hydrolase (TIGR01459 family)
MAPISAPSGANIPILPSIAPLAATSRAWLVDVWGVMHNGVVPFAGAGAACARFRTEGGIVLLLSNAPRPGASVAAQLDRIGVVREAYDEILSSGDASRAFIADLSDASLFHLGPERDLPLYDGLGVRLTGAEDASAIVCTGLYDDETETPDDYTTLLTGFALRRLPMICANPDLTVERGEKLVYCAGAIAERYEALGGVVTYAGKPHLPVYEMAFEAVARRSGGSIPRSGFLAIGDGIRTDIAGAVRAGVRSVYIASGVHVGAGTRLDQETLRRLFPEATLRPIAAMPSLVW